MRVDRTTFLLAALGMYACHAEHKRRATDESKPPEPARVQDASSIDAVAVEVVDAGVPDAAPVAIVDAGSETPLPPVLSFAELGRKCRAFPAARPDCGGDSQKRMCQTVLAEFDNAAASRAIECYGSLESTCDVCGVRTCTLNSLVGLPRHPVPECTRVAEKAKEQDDESYGKLMLDLCEEYASGMTARGRKRFARCLSDNMGLGVRFCLWDPSATPCTEGDRRDPPPKSP